MLRALTGRRGEMAKCMAFSLEHADAVSEVSEIEGYVMEDHNEVTF